MSYQEAEQLLNELVKKPVFTMAFSHLAPGKTIQVELEGQKFHFLHEDGGTKCRSGESDQADVEFCTRPEALRVLLHEDGHSLSGFGLAVLQQIASGQIRIQVLTSTWSIMRGGYISLVVAGGPEVMGYLAQKGFGSVQKIVSAIRGLKA